MTEVIYLLADPIFILDRSGAILEANEAGERLLVSLLPMGSRGSLGAAELALLFQRGAERDLAPSPCVVETAEGPMNFEARFGRPDSRGRKTAILSDVTIWKRALAEKDSVIRQFRMERERPVAVCARCGAIKGQDGFWGAAGEVQVAGIASDRLSHGLCPSCLALQLGPTGMGQGTVNAALAQPSQS